MQAKKFFRKTVKILIYGLVLCFIFLVLLEISYRYYWFDFYATEDQYLNENSTLGGKKTLLIFGDSFSAGGHYVDLLQQSNPSLHIVNAGIPGTGIREASIIAADRIQKYKPDIILFQVYVGNDFVDLKHDGNLRQLSPIRNIYWWLSDRFLSIRYINYKLGQFKSEPIIDPKTQTAFDVSKYNPRQKLLFDADAGYLRDALLMQGKQQSKVASWFEYFDAIRAQLDSSTSVCIMLIPHGAQVSAHYERQMEQLGSSALTDEILNPNHCPINLYFSDECSKRGIRFLNPQACFQHADSCGKVLYFENDFHLSKAGDSLMNVYLSRELKNIAF